MSVTIGVLEGVIKLRDEFTSALNRAASQLEQTGKKAHRIGESLSGVGQKLTQTLTLPLLAVSGYAVKAASDFESSFAGVIKTVDGLQDEFGNLTREGSELQTSLRNLAKERPIDVNQLNAVAEAAGQLGIVREDIIDFTKVMTDMQVSTNLSADEAATSLAQFQNIFGAIGKETSNLGATIVALGNAGASTERDIVAMGLRIAGAGKQIGLTQGQVLAIANALTSVGIEAEAGGSAISKVLIDMSLAVVNGGRELTNFAAVARMSASEFQKAFRDDAAGALDTFIKGLASVGGEEALRILDQMEIKEVRMRDALLRAAGAGDVLSDSLKLQSQAWKDNNALTDEAAKRYQTFQSQVVIVWNRIKDTAITLGTALLPVLRNVLETLQPLIDRLASAAQWFADLPGPVQTLALGLTAVVAAAGPLLVIVGSLVTAWGSLAAILPTLSAGLTTALGVITGPVGWIAAGTMLLLSIKPVREELVRLGQQILSGLQSAINTIRGSFSSWSVDLSYLRDEIKNLASTIGKDLLTVLNGLAKALVVVIQFQAQTIGLIVESIGKFISWANSIKEVRLIVEGLVTWLERLYKIGRLVSGLAILDILGKGQGQAQQQKPQLFMDPISMGPNASKSTDKLKTALAGVNKELDQISNNDAINILSEDAEKAGIDLSKVRAELAEQKRYLQELFDLGRKGPGLDLAVRLKREQDINDQHEYRLDLLQKQEQFGKRIGKELADAALALKKWEREVNVRLKVSLDLPDLDAALDASSVKLYTQSMQDLLVVMNANEEAARSYEAQFRAQRDSVDAWWDSFTSGVREGFSTAKDELELYKQTVIEAHRRGGDSALSAAEMERELSSIREQQIVMALDNWQTFFSYLGNMFDGIARQISQSLSNIQAAYQAGKKMDASGMMGGMTGAMGGAMATVAVIYEIYKAVDAQIKKNKARKWGDVIDFDFTEGVEAMTYFDENGREFARSFSKILHDIVNSMGAVLDNLPSITIRGRKDAKEFSAYVGGIFVGTFRDAQSAMEEAIAYAIQHADFDSISQEFATVLRNSIGANLEELQQNIEVARTVRTARIGDAGAGYVDMSDRHRQEIAEAERLGLAIDDLIAAHKRERDSYKNNVLGIDTAVSDQLRAINSLSKGIGEASSSIEATTRQHIDRIQEDIDRMMRYGPKPDMTDSPGGGGNSGPPTYEDGSEDNPLLKDIQSDWDAALAELRRQQALYIAELDKIPKALSDQEINMGIFDALYTYLQDSPKYAKEAVKYAKLKVEIEFATIKAQLIALGKWEEFASMFDDAYRAAMAAAGGKGGKGRGAGGNSERDSARDFVRDRRFELSLGGMSEYQRAMAELDKQYEELFKQAGKDHKLREDLIALKEEEIRLIEQQIKQSTVANFQSFLGLGQDQFSKIRETAEELIKQIEDSPFGDARKARMIGRVMEEVDEQVKELAESMSVGLFGRMISDLENAGMAEGELAEARKAMAMLEHAIKVENYRKELELIRAQGKVAPAVMAALDAAFGKFAALDPLAGFNTAYDRSRNRELMQARQIDLQQELANAYQRANDLLQKYRDEGMNPYARALRDLNKDFELIRRSLGDTAEITNEYNLALGRLKDQFLESLRDFYNELNTGSLSALTPEDQLSALRSQIDTLLAGVNAGNLSLADDLASSGQEYIDLLGSAWGTSTEEFQTIRQQILDMLAPVLGISTGTGLGQAGSIIGGPEWFTQGSNMTVAALDTNTDRTVSATNDLSSVVDFRSERQERLLQAISDRLDRVIDRVSGVESAMTNLQDGSIGYGS